MQERLFTIHQVAELLGATSSQVLQWIRRGWLTSQRLPDGPIRISEGSLIRFLKGRGIDIMQLMVSTAVRDSHTSGRRAKPKGPAAAARQPVGPGELPMFLADEGPPESPPPEQDADEELAIREMLTGMRPPAPAETLEDDAPAEPPPAETPPADETPPEQTPPQDVPEVVEVPAEPPDQPAPEPAAEPHTAPDPPAPADAAEQVAHAILEDAVARRASHVHLEPRPDGPALRLRIDGVLRDKPKFREHLPDTLAGGLLERLLQWADLAPAEMARPRSGRFVRRIGMRDVTFELSSLPTTRGPRLVLAVRGAAEQPALAALGLPAEAREQIERLLASDDGGMVLVAARPRREAPRVLRALAGPLSAGASCVLALAAGDEDIVPGACQSRIAPLEGYTFADAARGLLAQDADALVLGELRDPVTAAAAMEAALAGRIVLAGISAATPGEGVERLTDMHLEPWSLAAALRGVVVWRSVRRLCDECRRAVTDAPELPPALGLSAESLETTPYRPVGCARCANTGYLGRLELVAVWRPDRQARRRIGTGAAAEAVDDAGRELTAEAIRRLAAQHLRDGTTSLEEIARIL